MWGRWWGVNCGHLKISVNHLLLFPNCGAWFPYPWVWVRLQQLPSKRIQVEMTGCHSQVMSWETLWLVLVLCPFLRKSRPSCVTLRKGPQAERRPQANSQVSELTQKSITLQVTATLAKTMTATRTTIYTVSKFLIYRTLRWTSIISWY